MYFTHLCLSSTQLSGRHTETSVNIRWLYELMEMWFRLWEPMLSLMNSKLQWKPAIKGLQNFYYTNLSGMQKANVSFQLPFLSQSAFLHPSLPALLSVLILPVWSNCCLPVYFQVYNFSFQICVWFEYTYISLVIKWSVFSKDLNIWVLDIEIKHIFLPLSLILPTEWKSNLKYINLPQIYLYW